MKRFYRRTVIVVIAVIVLALANVAVRSYRDEMYVDLSSGDVLKKKYILNILLSQLMEESTFSAAARSAGYVPDRPPNWRIDTIRRPYHGLREHPMYHGAISSLNQVVQAWEMTAQPNGARARQAAEALRLLQVTENRLYVDINDDGQITLEHPSRSVAK